ncbi:hypothetical protein ZIOFF_001586 [Zingiber officinale]|uniref:DAGKc domain-containing protein n=1 Tax=Zingiber officinale TaxID=94328 RepID=A0A8J5IMW0_ZINOF|nr:hypothetical protein ZIOFF_001586 [Zingiber officinale]
MRDYDSKKSKLSWSNAFIKKWFSIKIKGQESHVDEIDSKGIEDPASFGVMLKIFILAMLGITIQQNVYYVGLHLISPTVASALGNVIPAFTFLLAIVLRMEKLNLKIVRGRARLARTIFCITGALIFTFWKGHLLGAFVTSPMIQLHFETPEKGNACLKGSALMLFGYFACSVSLVLQASICEIYPAKLTMNAVMCFFVALQSSALSLIFKRNASSWRMFPLFTHVILCIVFVWVLNGLLSRDNQKEALSIPIGIIPAGSDNSLVWTILGVRDPISAAMATFAYIYIYIFVRYYLCVFIVYKSQVL